MRTTVRFEAAVSKLYKAYHAGDLVPIDCAACAVGNIVGDRIWASIIPTFGNELIIDYPHLPNVLNSGYSALELRQIEFIFMFGNANQGKRYGSFLNITKSTKESQFDGLCAVIEYLCELDGIPNVMDYTSLFETEADKPKRQLSEVFI